MSKASRKTRMIVDSNFLQTEDLRLFLMKSSQHYAVLDEFVGMDMFKGKTTLSVCRSSAILCEFPKQVIVLKIGRETQHCIEPVANAQRRLIDTKLTEEFGDFCEAIDNSHHPNVQRQLRESGAQATRHADVVSIEHARKVAARLPSLLALFTDTELRTLRTNREMPKELIKTVLGHVMLITADAFASIGVARLPAADALFDTLVFRQQLCLYIWTLLLFRGKQPTAPSRIRNDIFDAAHAAYATFFDGILSKDELPNAIHSTARSWLYLLGARINL